MHRNSLFDISLFTAILFPNLTNYVSEFCFYPCETDSVGPNILRQIPATFSWPFGQRLRLDEGTDVGFA